MDKKSYADILKFAIKTQIDYVVEEMDTCRPERYDYLDGVVRGLEIALDKINASMFLVEK